VEKLRERKEKGKGGKGIGVAEASAEVLRSIREETLSAPPLFSLQYPYSYSCLKKEVKLLLKLENEHD
jgi:hypothetical protein